MQAAIHSNIEIRKTSESRGQICNDLLRLLPQWFGIDSAIQAYVQDVENMPMYVAFAHDRLIGFISVKQHNAWTAEIYVMAVHPDYHRQKIGKKLVICAENDLKQSHHKFLSVKTLSPLRQNINYEQTRLFYQAIGFYPVEEFKTLWDEDNPCLLMIKSLT